MEAIASSRGGHDAKRRRQRRYRERLASRRAPEASAADVAIAGSAVAYIDAIEAGLGTAADRKVLRLLIRGALDLLVKAGYDRAEGADVIRRRVTRHGRKDLQQLVEASRVRLRLRRDV